jgi:hypothetical protein
MQTATCSSTKQKERIVAFPWQQWLGQRATVLRYTYISCLGISYIHHNVTLFSDAVSTRHT